MDAVTILQNVSISDSQKHAWQWWVKRPKMAGTRSERKFNRGKRRQPDPVSIDSGNDSDGLDIPPRVQPRAPKRRNPVQIQRVPRDRNALAMNEGKAISSKTVWQTTVHGGF